MTKSPIADLVEVLKTVLKSARAYRPQFQSREAATRAALVDPVLRALGWDVADPVAVEVERGCSFHGTKKEIDYALKAKEDVLKFVEAKRLDEDLSKHYHQLVMYAFAEQISEAFLTDGIRWAHFKRLDPKKLTPDWEANLERDKLEPIAAYLVQELDKALIAPDEEEKIDAIEADLERLKNEVERLRALERRLTALEGLTSPASVHTANPQVSPARNWTVLSPQLSVTGRKPLHLRLPNGEEHSCTRWNHVLVEACRFVLTAQPNLPLPLSDQTRGARNVIQLTPLPPNLGSTEIVVNGRTYYIHHNYSANVMVANVLHVLGQVPRELRLFEPAIEFA